MHCHLLAGVDDGPRTEAEALEMCRIAFAEGVRMAAATAHQNERWKAVTPERIRTATEQLAGSLRQADLPLIVMPCAEVMAHPDLETTWRNGGLLTVANRGEYLLLEMPHGLFVDLGDTVKTLREAGVRPILAHPERQPEFLHDTGRIERLIRMGCLVQVSSHSVTDPPSGSDARALKSWFKRGIVHVLGSDGHSVNRRPPRMAGAYKRIAQWVGNQVADRVCSTTGMAILQGLPVRVPEPEPPPRKARWLPQLSWSWKS
jgi:protein-tyrosine phosphatase